MLHHVKTLDDLKEVAIRVDGSMILRFPNRLPSRMLEMHRPHLSPDKKRTYAERNGIVAFVDEPDDAQYIVPMTKRVNSILFVEGFKKSDGIVPLADGDYPDDAKMAQKWQRLLDDRIDILRTEFMENCKEYCAMHGVKEFNLGLMRLCLDIPESGLGVTNEHYSEIIRPQVCFEDGMKPSNTAKLGTYATRNGITVFVNPYGRTYVTASQHFVDILIDSGYSRYSNGMFVPFTNGESIMSREYSTRWESVKLACKEYDRKVETMQRKKPDAPVPADDNDKY